MYRSAEQGGRISPPYPYTISKPWPGFQAARSSREVNERLYINRSQGRDSTPPTPFSPFP